jgi:protoporphyrinogen oxidase
VSRCAIIIGAGPAGLTAACELLTRSDVVPVVLEMSDQVGGLAKTVTCLGNRMDIGGHRFFSKSARVVDWWLDLLPLQHMTPGQILPLHVAYSPSGPNPDLEDRVMLMRERHSRICFDGQFFEYPIRLSPGTFRKLGPWRASRIAFTYLHRALIPIVPEQTLEDFMINRFGDALYHLFFEAYTQKVWGVPCRGISADWGAQRIKDVSVGKALAHWWRKRRNPGRPQETSTSMVERFLYPKLGPGQLWELAANRVAKRGGEVLPNRRVVNVKVEGGRVTEVEAIHEVTGAVEHYAGDYFFSTMPVKELIAAMGEGVSSEAQRVANGLVYRDFIAVGLLLRQLKRGGDCHGEDGSPDSWLYIQDPGVQIGRLQFYNHWSPYMVGDRSLAWLGLEYFCEQGGELWRLSDEDMISLAARELASLGIIDTADVLDGGVLRVPKAYPAYFGTYPEFDVIRAELDPIENLFLIGRNGMHRYNNQDHSMLTAMAAVDNILAGVLRKDNIWAINTEEEYLEEADPEGQ